MKRLLRNMLFFPSLTTLSFSIIAHAQQTDSIQEICLQSQLQCLLGIDSRQPKTKTKSFEWYQLEMLRHSSLFELERYDELIVSLELWQNYEGLPHSFSLSVAIHKAKMLIMVGEKPAAYEELTYAVSLLSDITSFNGNPMLIVMMANALYAMGEIEHGYQVLIALEQKYKHSQDPLLKREMYANLAHLSTRLNRIDESIVQRILSLEGALEVGNTQQIGVAYHNLASAYKSNEQYFEAITNFQKANDFSRQSFDKNISIKSKLKMIECYTAIGNYVRGEEVLRTINVKALTSDNKEMFDGLVKVINEKSPAK